MTKNKSKSTLEETQKAQKILIRHNLLKPDETYSKLRKGKRPKCYECGSPVWQYNTNTKEYLSNNCGLICARYNYPSDNKVKEIIKNRNSRAKLKEIVQRQEQAIIQSKSRASKEEAYAKSKREEKPKEWSICSIMGFILSFWGVFMIIGTVLCLIGLSETKDGRKKGRAWAIAGLVMQGIIILMVAITVLYLLMLGE